MKKTISFFDSNLGGPYQEPEELNINNTVDSLVWLYGQISRLSYLVTYIGDDPYATYNRAVRDAANAVLEVLKEETKKDV